MAQVFCRIVGHKWQPVLPGNLRVCMRCHTVGFLVPLGVSKRKAVE